MFCVDLQLDIAGRERLTVEQVPPALAIYLDAGDGRASARPLDGADVAHLTTAAGMEGGSGQDHRAWPGVDHGRGVDVQARLFMTEIDRHADRLESCRL